MRFLPNSPELAYLWPPTVREVLGEEHLCFFLQRMEERLREMPRRLERLKKSGLKRRSRTDPDSRFLPARGKFTLGYTAPVAVSVKIL